MITLYFCKFSRAFVPRWLLEELGVDYRARHVCIDRGEQKAPDYLRINPMGKIPALTDGDTMVAENPAICMLLGDRYGYGSLAPRIEDDRRGAYLKWMVFATAVFEPAIYSEEPQDDASASGRGWGKRADVLRCMADAVKDNEWLLGKQFSAADVMLGGLLSIALHNQRIADPPAPLTVYDKRLSARPAYQRAAKATFS